MSKKMFSALLAIFLSGALLGGIGTFLAVRREIRRIASLSPVELEQRTTRRLGRLLDLSDEQLTQTAAPITLFVREMARLKGKIRPEVNTAIAKLNSDLAPLLREDQQQRLDRTLKERMADFDRQIGPE